MKYRDGYKYQLAEEFVILTPIVGVMFEHEFFKMFDNGILVIRKGYAWDGASGPTIDTASSMTPSLVHDVLCQAMRLKLLSYEEWQDTVNEFFYEMCLDKGMWKWRAKYWWWAVESADCGKPDQGDPYPIKEAP